MTLWGIAEIADAVGVSWIDRHADFPEPFVILKCGRIYEAYHVLVWLNRHGKFKPKVEAIA